jgi:hypothetical protein
MMDPRHRSHKPHEWCSIRVLQNHLRVRGSVKFGDGPIVEIEGRGTILFLGKGGEHRRLTRVYYIP